VLEGSQYYLPFIHEWNEPSFHYSVSIHQMAPPERGSAHPITARYSFINLKRMKGWVGLVGSPCSGRFTHISGHQSAAGRAKDRESSPVTDRRSTTEPRNQLIHCNLASKPNLQQRQVTTRNCKHHNLCLFITSISCFTKTAMINITGISTSNKRKLSKY